MHWREKIFYDHYRDATGIELVYEPATFRMEIEGKRYSYRPDFYCPKTHVFYEVVGTRQAIYGDKFKISALRSSYPMVDLRIVNPDGSDYDFGPIGLGYRSESVVPRGYHQRVGADLRIRAGNGLREIANQGKYTLRELSERIGIRVPTLYVLIHRDGSVPHLRTAKAINSFLERETA